ncbi:MAG: hypothetical protein AB1847_16730 [bacterium]
MTPYIIASLIVPAASLIWGWSRRRNKKAWVIMEALQKWVPVACQCVDNALLIDPDPKRSRKDVFIHAITELLTSQGIKVTPEIITMAVAMAETSLAAKESC